MTQQTLFFSDFQFQISYHPIPKHLKHPRHLNILFIIDKLDHYHLIFSMVQILKTSILFRLKRHINIIEENDNKHFQYCAFCLSINKVNQTSNNGCS